MSVHEDGACVGMPTELFVHERERTDLTLKALSVCAKCPFKTECEALGRESGSVGVWGGKFLELPEEPTAETAK